MRGGLLPSAVPHTLIGQAGAFKIGDTAGTLDNIIACKLYRPGSVGFVSKSGGMSNEMYNVLSRATDGLYEGRYALGGSAAAEVGACSLCRLHTIPVATDRLCCTVQPLNLMLLLGICRKLFVATASLLAAVAACCQALPSVETPSLAPRSATTASVTRTSPRSR